MKGIRGVSAPSINFFMVSTKNTLAAVKYFFQLQ